VCNQILFVTWNIEILEGQSKDYVKRMISVRRGKKLAYLIQILNAFPILA
jgi:hypothetical protein